MLEKWVKEEKIHDWTWAALDLGSLEPAAIQFTLKRLQESARWSGCFLLAIFKYLYA